MSKKKSMLENVIVLVVLGVLAGAIGAAGVGMIQLHSMQTASSTAAAGGPPK
ncbi:MAG: hypothetical protein WBV46_21510 [Terriglobales bacterium]